VCHATLHLTSQISGFVCKAHFSQLRQLHPKTLPWTLFRGSCSCSGSRALGKEIKDQLWGKKTLNLAHSLLTELLVGTPPEKRPGGPFAAPPNNR